MATTAVNAILAPYLYDDAVVSVSASGLASATRGDWVIASAQWGIASVPGTIGSPAYKVSALGMAIENNPTFDPLGRGINNSGFNVITRFVARVTASASASARTIPIGAHAYPSTTASGIIGQSGATGVGVLWVTAPPQGISANPTGALASGVAQVINHPVGGDAGIGQIDIRVNLATNVGYF
jgi:hypothetical protein